MKTKNGFKIAIAAFCVFLIYQPAVYYSVWWTVYVVVGDVFDLRFPPRPPSTFDAAIERADTAAGNSKSLDGPWVKAIESGEVDQVRRLLDSGADIEQPLFMDAAPVVYAAAGEGWDIVLFLLQQGADPAVIDKRGFSVAYLAKTSFVAPDNKYGRALAEVKEMLRTKGLM